MKTLLLILVALSALSNAHAGDYYKLEPNVAASAERKGDELFAELVTNLPTSNIVNGPKSGAIRIYGSCSLRQYTKWSTVLFSEEWRAGYPIAQYGPDNLLLKVIPNTPLAKLFDRECNK